MNAQKGKNLIKMYRKEFVYMNKIEVFFKIQINLSISSIQKCYSLYVTYR